MVNDTEGTLSFKEWKKSIEENCAGCTFTCNELLKMYFDDMDAVMLKTGHNGNTMKEIYALVAELVDSFLVQVLYGSHGKNKYIYKFKTEKSN
ncbi:MAG: hypothetical protein Q7J10_09540 [Methanosarcinaceae archaeon]|nr:hypothetical protein [Methanosarcinaceae archaeon]